LPTALAVVVVLVDQQPLLAACAVFGPRLAGAYQHEATGELLAVEVEVQLPALDGCDRVVGSRWLPRPPVPHDDVTAAVLAFRDDALEVEVLDGVVLDVHRQLPRLGVPRRSPRHGP